MASNHGGKDVMDSGSSEVNNSEATVEIKIKTLDSQTYTLRVDKCVYVPALKEQIASVTGVLSDQQRLICRGKVLKDDQLLSAYHVEDGHTLHLVARQPINPSLASFPDHTGVSASMRYQGSFHQSLGSLLILDHFTLIVMDLVVKYLLYLLIYGTCREYGLQIIISQAEYRTS